MPHRLFDTDSHLEVAADKELASHFELVWGKMLKGGWYERNQRLKKQLCTKVWSGMELRLDVRSPNGPEKLRSPPRTLSAKIMCGARPKAKVRTQEGQQSSMIFPQH